MAPMRLGSRARVHVQGQALFHTAVTTSGGGCFVLSPRGAALQRRKEGLLCFPAIAWRRQAHLNR